MKKQSQENLAALHSPDGELINEQSSFCQVSFIAL